MNTAFSSRKLLFTGSCIVSIALALAACGGGGGGGGNPSIVSYYVAPNGSDSNPGTITQPYLTIQKCATTFASGSACQIRAGTYHETVTPNSGVIITSYNGESVTIDGTDAVTGWTLSSGSIYKASVTPIGVFGSGDTNQVFVGQQMMTEARWPNGDDLFHVNWAIAGANTSTTDVFDSNLPPSIIANWTGAHINFWSGTDPWSHQTATVTASAAGQLTFTLDGASSIPYITPMLGGYYYVFGALGALDTQREWFYDSTAGTLYFWAPGGVDPTTLDVRIKTRQFAFDLSGKSNVAIQNINLFASGIKTNGTSTNNTISGITATYLSHFTTSPSALFTHLADSGIVLNGTGNVLTDSTIAYSAGNGVTVLGTNINVRNNLIHHVDYIGNYTAGISIQGSGHNIQNNTIYATGRSAIYLNEIQNPAMVPSYDNISYNNVFNTMMLVRDGGAIYAAGQPGVTGTRIHHNWIHDTQPIYAGPGSNYPLSGVYFDQNTSGYEFDQNILWNNAYYNIFIGGSGGSNQTAPNDNSIHNNTIADVAAHAYILLGGMINCGTTQAIDNNVLVNVVNTGTACVVSNNSATAPGANEMTSSVQTGCNFAGCSTNAPPTISRGLVAASIATQPYSLTVTAGSTATFSVTGAGSGTLGYQWLKNGSTISGATTSTYTTPATISADNGTVFSVTVSNSVGSVNSSAATLTLQ
jgi:hypothetical protein